MKYIVEHFGTGLLSGTVAVFLISFFVNMMMPGGMVNNFIWMFMTGISG